MKNLEAEMARNSITINDIRNVLQCSEKTVRNKINGDTDFYFSECLKIRNAFFQGLRLEYLFAADKTA